MAKTGRPNFAYLCQGTWRGLTHNFQITGNTTGAALSAADAKIFMEGTGSPYAKSFAPFQGTQQVAVIGVRYYNGTSSAPVYEADYASGAAPAPLTPTATAFSQGAGQDSLPLEVCVMVEATVGTSRTGKPVYCRKFLRGAPIAGLSDTSQWDFASEAASAASAMGNGSWYNGIQYCSPSGATAGSGGWTALSYPSNHQVPRGKKRSKTATATAAKQSSLLSELLQAIGAGSSATALEKIIADFSL